MKYFRAMCTGALVWLCVSISFTILESVPQIKDSLLGDALERNRQSKPYRLVAHLSDEPPFRTPSEDRKPSVS